MGEEQDDDWLDFIDMLTDVDGHPEYQQVYEVSGEEVATAYVVALNCIEHVAAGNDDDWLIAIIRDAYSKMGTEGQARLGEQGL